MRRCFALARRGEYGAHPNPMVGSLLLREGAVLAEGWHARCGERHAEAMALDLAGEQARGADLYVSLEPCSHWGRQPPCADRILAAGVKRLIYGMRDPNPQVAGQGLERIRAAGIEVVGPVLEEDARALNPGFVKRMEQGLPWLRCKLAMSLDGRTAMASGESKWITGAAARADVQQWRARSGAVVTGVETVLADDPSMNARLEVENLRQPLRVVVDSRLRTPPRARVLGKDGGALIATGRTEQEVEAWLAGCAAPQPRVVSLPGLGGLVHLSALLRHLAREEQCNEVLLESGAHLAGACLKAGLVDEMLIYMAPLIMGSEARPLFDLPGVASLAEGIRLAFEEVVLLGGDCRIRARPVPGP